MVAYKLADYMGMNKKRLEVHVEQQQYKDVKKKAKEKGVSISTIIRELIEKYL